MRWRVLAAVLALAGCPAGPRGGEAPREPHGGGDSANAPPARELAGDWRCTLAIGDAAGAAMPCRIVELGDGPALEQAAGDAIIGAMSESPIGLRLNGSLRRGAATTPIELDLHALGDAYEGVAAVDGAPVRLTLER